VVHFNLLLSHHNGVADVTPREHVQARMQNPRAQDLFGTWAQRPIAGRDDEASRKHFSLSVTLRCEHKRAFEGRPTFARSASFGGFESAEAQSA
jgi:hypothetical protein